MNRLKVCLAVVGILGAMLAAAPTARADFLYATDTGSHTIRSMDTQGNVTQGPSGATTFGSGASPSGIAVDNNTGNLYVLNSSAGSLFQVTPGGVVTTLVASGLANAQGLAVDSTNGNIIITNPGAGTVQRYNSLTTGGAVSTIASSLNTPQYVTVDKAGNVFFTAVGGLQGDVQEMTRNISGTYNAPNEIIAATGNLTGIKFGNGSGANGNNTLYFANNNGSTSQSIMRATLSGGVWGAASTFASITTGAGLAGLVIDGANTVFVASPAAMVPGVGTGVQVGTNNGIWTISSGGAVNKIAYNGNSSATLASPYDLALAPAAVPEPSSLLLTGLGVGVMGAYRRWSKRRNKAAVAAS